MDKQPERQPIAAVAIIGRLRSETLERLKDALDVQQMTQVSDPETLIFNGRDADPQALWRKASQVVNEEAVVVPLLRDDEGHRLIPTGVLQVRFKTQLADKQIAAFAQRHDLKVVGRNRWDPRQASFAIRPGDRRLLTEIEAALDADETSEAAWPDTRAYFRREKQ